MTKSLVIGAGSIGLRHSEILDDLGHQTAFVSKRNDLDKLTFSKVSKAIEIFEPNYIVIANETYKHLNTIRQVYDCNFQNKILVEKPIFHNLKKMRPFEILNNNIFVGYNLRFHPCIQFIKNLLLTEEVLSANIYVGQFLPNWRPSRDYSNCYSSDYKKGGGVFLELSHEFDYLLYLFGKCNKSISLNSRLTNLNINCDDSAVGILEFEKCKQISFNLNLIDKQGRREIILNTDKNTYKIDIYNNKVFFNNKIKRFSINKNETYKKLHLNILNGNYKSCCTFEESIETLKLIERLQKPYKFKK